MKFTLFTMAFALLAILPFSAQAGEQTTKDEASPLITAVSFHSDHCGSCKAIAPRMGTAKQIINPDKLSIVKFDFTSKESIEATNALAKEKDVDSLLQKYGARTGFIVLIDNAGKEVDKITVDDDTAEIAAKLATAIANAS